MMLQRNLLYTAVTRAKQLVVLVGSPRALGQAVRATGAGRRHTALARRLRGRPSPAVPTPDGGTRPHPPLRVAAVPAGEHS
jgi:exodeoxyribonuclease V alpha subunit